MQMPEVDNCAEISGPTKICKFLGFSTMQKNAKYANCIISPLVYGPRPWSNIELSVALGESSGRRMPQWQCAGWGARCGPHLLEGLEEVLVEVSGQKEGLGFQLVAESPLKSDRLWHMNRCLFLVVA
eukprot:GGOE01024305.1.p2 GENE.GGOE01024305.1~~GGOE01024305.1.p2  ORF type:complete len:127 (-),score=2.10 GGOE01024305.1:127-507(-)